MVALIISNLCIMLMLTLISNHLLEPKTYPNCAKVAVFLIAWTILSYTNSSGPSASKSIVFIICYFSYTHIMFTGSIIKKIAVTVLLFISVFMTELCSFVLFNYVVGIDVLSNRDSIEFILSLVVSNLFSVTIIMLFINCIKRFKNLSYPNYSVAILILPLTTILLGMNIKDFSSLIKSDSVLIFVLMGLFVSNIFTIIVFYIAVHSMNVTKKLELSKQKEELLNDRQLLLQQQYNYSFNFLHALLHNSINLNKLLEEKKYDSLKVALNSLTNTTFAEFNNMYSNSVVLNTVLSVKRSEIHHLDINFKTVLESNEFNFIPSSMLYDFFSVILEYLIDQCRTVDNRNRYIILKSKRINNQFIIQAICSSSSDSELNKETEVKNILNKILEGCNYFVSVELKNSSLYITIMFK